VRWIPFRSVSPTAESRRVPAATRKSIHAPSSIHRARRRGPPAAPRCPCPVRERPIRSDGGRPVTPAVDGRTHLPRQRGDTALTRRSAATEGLRCGNQGWVRRTHRGRRRRDLDRSGYSSRFRPRCISRRPGPSDHEAECPSVGAYAKLPPRSPVRTRRQTRVGPSPSPRRGAGRLQRVAANTPKPRMRAAPDLTRTTLPPRHDLDVARDRCCARAGDAQTNITTTPAGSGTKPPPLADLPSAELEGRATSPV